MRLSSARMRPQLVEGFDTLNPHRGFDKLGPH
jgi:hypothetical protein